MCYRIAGIDVHKRMLAVVIADVASEGEYQFERRKVGTSPEQLRLMAEWLLDQPVEEAVMESTAQYWKPVWQALSSTGSRLVSSGKPPEGCQGRCIWRRRGPTADRAGARTISPTPNVW
jgi:hypothetical protein